MAEVIWEPQHQKCKDCKAEGRTAKPLDAPYPGPRCHRHNLAWKRRTRNRNHDRRVQSVHGLRPGEYAKLKEKLGGKCALCQKATGAARALAVEYDHGHCEICRTSGGSCGAPESIRGLACGPCNEAIGRFSVETLIRMVRYLLDPPGPAIIRALREDTP